MVGTRGRRNLLGWGLLAPSLVLVLGLVAYPAIYDVALALAATNGFSAPTGFVGLSNFEAVLSDAEFWQAARNSLLYTLFTATLRVTLGLGMATALWRMRRGRAVVFIALFVAWIFPATLSAFAFYWLLSPPFHTFYTLPLLQLRWTLAGFLGEDLWQALAVALHDVWRSSAFVAIFLLAGLNSLSSDQLDYAALECGGWRRFWLVVVPMLRKFLALAVLLSLVMSFLDYTGTYLETGGRVTWPLLGTLAYQESFLNGRTPLGSAMTLMQLPVWLLLIALGFRVFERAPRSPPTPEPAAPAVAQLSRCPPATRPIPAPASPLAGVTRPAATHATAVRRRADAGAFLTLGLPIVLFALFPVWWIFLQAVRPISEDRYGNPFWTWAPTLNGFTSALQGRLVGAWLLNTFIVLAVGVAVTIVAGALAGYALSRQRVRGARWIARGIFATYFLPYPMLLVPVYQLFVWLGLDNTLLSVIVLNQTLTVPFATWLCFTYFDGLPPDAEEHATLDGSDWQVLRHIVLPMSWPVLIAAGIFAAGVLTSDVVYAGLLLVHDNAKTVAVGLGLIGISLDEFDTISGGIGMAATPLVAVCAAFAPAYVRGLSAAMIEGA
ncbi:MAG TPA: ABC transporter permease subunit [Chloroflexota bacterium]